MPIYEFRCKDCQNDFEVLLPTTRWKGTVCSRCGSGRVTKKLSVFAAANSAPKTAPPQGCTGNPRDCGGCEWRPGH